MIPRHNHANGEEVDPKVFNACPRCRQPKCACDHVWEKQERYCCSNILRYKCSKCGHWGYKQLSKLLRPVIREYVANGAFVVEPRPDWKSQAELNVPDWNDVGGRQPDRNTPDDNASDYKPPRRQ